MEFVDASDQPPLAAYQGSPAASGDLKANLEETKVILRMALSNEFVSALEICSRR